MRLQWDGCGFPGCDQPYEHCQAHHETLAWDDGGLTNTDDMIPLCNGHHRLKHRAHWTITMDPDGTVHAHRPDGHHLTDTRRRATRTRRPDSDGRHTIDESEVATHRVTEDDQTTAGASSTGGPAPEGHDEPILFNPMRIAEGGEVQRTTLDGFSDRHRRRATIGQFVDWTSGEAREVG